MIRDWHHLLGTFTGVALLTAIALPVCAVLVWLLARRRGGTPWAWRRSLAEVGIVWGTVPGVWLILLPGSHGGVSLIPLRDLFSMPVGQIIGNLVVFAALGFLAPMRFTAFCSVWRVLALGAACSIVVELAQYVLRLDRVSSVDDVLLNAVGAGLAAWASRRWWRVPAADRSPALTG